MEVLFLLMLFISGKQRLHITDEATTPHVWDWILFSNAMSLLDYKQTQKK